DSGRGIPAADRGRAVERFVRLEQSRSLPGSGLGLSLASAVARLHGGELKLEDNHPGLKTGISLPRSGSAPPTALNAYDSRIMGRLVITASGLARPAARNAATARKPQMRRHSRI